MDKSSNAIALQDLVEGGIGPALHWYLDSVPLLELASTLVGMANDDGGRILLGIEPKYTKVQGVRNIEAAVDRIFRAALLIDPPIVLPLPLIIETNGLRIVKCTVPSGLPHVYSLEGRYYTRCGDKNCTIPARELRKLMMARGETYFENRVPEGATMDDLDPELVRSYSESLMLPKIETPEGILIRRSCLSVINGTPNPTYAALLLFGRRPQQWLPSATILVARFPGISFSDEFLKQEIRGALPDQLRQAESFVSDHLRSVVHLVGLEREEILEYHPEAVREILVNAVAHRDYNQQGDCIHLHIFSDRLEIHSPGGLPGPVNLENLLDARFSRNAVIAQVLSDMGFVERLGYGLNRVVNVMRQNNLPEPIFEEVGGSFRVTLQSAFSEDPKETVKIDTFAYLGLDLNPRQELALKHLFSRGRITNRAYQELCPEVSPETIRRDLVDMVKKSLLIRVGDKKTTYYILKNKE